MIGRTLDRYRIDGKLGEVGWESSTGLQTPSLVVLWRDRGYTDGRSVFYGRIDSTINDLMLVEDFR